MNEKPNFLDLWTGIATTLFGQALTGEPEFVESLPKPMPQGSPAFTAQIEGELAGRFLITLDAGLLEATLLGEGVDQATAWFELLRETIDATIGEIVVRTGLKLKRSDFACAAAEGSITRAYQLKTVDRTWSVTVRDEIKEGKAQAAAPPAETKQALKREKPESAGQNTGLKTDTAAALTGFELLFDVELEASLRFGAREMPLGEILELGPGDVVQLDRNIADPVDLLVGDKIVARGEVVLVNGNFALRVLEVAAPERRLESVRCLF